MLLNNNLPIGIQLEGAEIDQSLPSDRRPKLHQTEPQRRKTARIHKGMALLNKKINHFFHSLIQILRRRGRDKSNDSILFMRSWRIGTDDEVKEMLWKGSKFTWTNKQLNLVMSVLDRVLVGPRWEQYYRKASCESLTRVGSDHSPIIVNTEDHRFKQQHSFCFEPA
jgi:hypothetical protein